MCIYVQIGKGDSGKHLSWILLEAAVGISVMSWSSKCPCFQKYPLTHTPISNPSNLTGYQSGLQCNHYFHLFLVPISFLFLGEQMHAHVSLGCCRVGRQTKYPSVSASIWFFQFLCIINKDHEPFLLGKAFHITEKKISQTKSHGSF